MTSWLVCLRLTLDGILSKSKIFREFSQKAFTEVKHLKTFLKNAFCRTCSHLNLIYLQMLSGRIINGFLWENFCWYEKHVEISEQLRKCWSLYNKKSLVLSLWHSFQLTLMKSFSIKKGHNAFMHIITYWVCLRCWNDFKYLIATYIIWLSANVNINAKLLKKAVFGNNFV